MYVGGFNLAKSYRTAFICVPKVNKTGENKDVIIEYTQDQIKETLSAWSFTAGIEYWGIDHIPDDDDPNDHFHLVIRFRNPEHFDSIKNKFPYGRIEPAKNVKRAVQYLVHMNSPEKIQYSWDQVFTNVPDLTPFKVQSRSQQDVSLQRIFEQIDSGEITSYNYQSIIPTEIFSKHKSVIQNALDLNLRRIASNPTRSIKVLYFYGRPGIGKTVFAKRYFESIGYRFCPSSSSNDPLQDYSGEPGLLWDDFRDSSMSFSDLLKFLDPDTRSSGKSRYRNKDFIGDLIIITSNQRMDFLYKNYMQQNENSGEDMRALRRRLHEYYEFKEDFITIYQYDKFRDSYTEIKKFKNPITEDVERAPSGSDIFDSSAFESMGIELIDSDSKSNRLNCEKWGEEWKATGEGRKFFDELREYLNYLHCSGNSNSVPLFGGERTHRAFVESQSGSPVLTGELDKMKQARLKTKIDEGGMDDRRMV